MCGTSEAATRVPAVAVVLGCVSAGVASDWRHGHWHAWLVYGCHVIVDWCVEVDRGRHLHKVVAVARHIV